MPDHALRCTNTTIVIFFQKLVPGAGKIKSRTKNILGGWDRTMWVSVFVDFDTDMYTYTWILQGSEIWAPQPKTDLGLTFDMFGGCLYIFLDKQVAFNSMYSVPRTHLAVKRIEATEAVLFYWCNNGLFGKKIVTYSIHPPPKKKTHPLNQGEAAMER